MDPNNLQSSIGHLHRESTPSSNLASAFSFTTPTDNVNSITTFPLAHTQVCNQQNSILQENEINLFHIKESVNDYFDPFDFSELPNHPPTSHISPTIPFFVNEGSGDQSNHHHQQQQQQKRNQPRHEKKQEYQSLDTSDDTRTRSETRNQAMKRNKETRRIYQVPFVEKIATRSWRKYGRKPIKGSPYPRGYYRCNLAKGCLARKQVDQKISNPDVLVITYIGEHNHPLPPSPNGERENNQKTKIDESKDVGDDNVLDEVIDDGLFDVIDDGMFEGLDDIVDLP